MRRHPDVFSPFYVSMVRVGEATGMLEEIFLRLFHYLEFEKSTKDKIKAAMRYPSFVFVAMVVAIAIINLFVIPAFAKVYKGFNATGDALVARLRTFRAHDIHVLGSFIFGLP